jgi:hypothetical protein
LLITAEDPRQYTYPRNLEKKNIPGKEQWKYICSSSAGAQDKKKERQDETQFITKIDGFLSFLMAMGPKKNELENHHLMPMGPIYGSHPIDLLNFKGP